MALKDKLVIELCTENLYGTDYHYANLKLPATEGQIEDAMQIARAIGREEYIQISVISCPRLPELMDTRLDSPTIEEMNFFAQSLEKLSENQLIGLNALFETQKEAGEYEDGVVIKDLINMTYDLDGLVVVAGIANDRELGEMVKANEMEPYLKDMSDEMVNMLDSEKVGLKFREAECGVFRNGYYVARLGYDWPEVYDGKTLPEPDRQTIGGGFITMKVAQSGNPDPFEAEKNSVLMGLPIDRAKADEIAQSLGEKCIEDCVYFDFQSPLSWLDDELYGDTQIFDKLNDVASTYELLSPDDRVKFKAVSESVQCKDLDTAKGIMNNLNKYQMSHYTDSYESYAREYMQLKLPTEFDTSILERCNLGNLGRELCDRLECVKTVYGVVSKEGGQIFATVRPVEDEEEQMDIDEAEQEMGGMQM